MKIYAKSVKQGEYVFYETSLPLEELIDEEMFTPDRWNPITQDGYQREVSTEHARRISRYLSDGFRNENSTNTLPTPVILNSRTPVETRALGNGLFELELKRFPLFIIDGQHRIQGAREAIEAGTELSGYELPVIVTQFNLRDEMVNFRNINTRANRAPKALSDVLMGKLAETYGMIPESATDQATIRATHIIQRLASDPESPWFGRVALGGTRRRSFHQTVQSAMAGSILTMFSNGRFSDPAESEENIYTIFKNFWIAVADVFPEAFENPSVHSIQRSLGYSTWHMVLNRILTNVNYNPTREQMRQSITKAASDLGMTSDFWGVGMNDGARRMAWGHNRTQAQRLVADEIWKAMPKDVLKEQPRVGL